MNKLHKILPIVITCFLLLSFNFLADDKTDEYTLKAIFFERFSRMVEWENDNPKYFIITVIGEHKFGDRLEEMYKTRMINKKKVIIKYITSIDDIESCNILFITPHSEPALKRIINAVAKRPILTIADQIGYAEKGVVLNYVISDGKLKYEVNLQAAKMAGLKLSYLLPTNAENVIQADK